MKSGSVFIWLLVVQLLLVSCANNATPSTQKEAQSVKAKQDENGKVAADRGEKSSNSETDTSKERKEKAQVKVPKLEFEYPDAVRGIYVTGHSAGGERMPKLINLIESTDLNSMVIDIKDDFGNITYEPEEHLPFASHGQPYIKDPEEMIKTLHDKEIYPIARIVVFKDSVLAKEKPELSFKRDGKVWENGAGHAFVSPFQKEVWEYNIAIAKEAAKLGFQEIQFDYVRFPEGFENLADNLAYDMGDYKDEKDPVQTRVKAVTDFVAYASKQLEPYDVDVSVDVFGYTVTLPEAPGIGQNISQISEHVDVISSMIYPSHWGFGTLGIDKPDLEPYKLLENYVVKEKEKLYRLEDPPTSRPWIQDFTATWLGSGNYQKYGKQEVEAQIRALNEAGIEEFLLWDASNSYTRNVNYTPDLDKAKVQKNEQADENLKQAIKQEQEDQVATKEKTEDGKADQSEKTSTAENEPASDEL